MNLLKSATLGFVIVALASSGAVRVASAADVVSDKDHATMKACMAMNSADMMQDAGCVALMKKLNMSPANMTSLKFCGAMSEEAMMKDTSCSAMMKLHPDMMSSEMATSETTKN